MTLITPEYLQTKKYSAKRDRLALAHGGSIQPGVWDSGDLKPTWSSAMNISLAPGFALVPANNSGNLGLYHIQNDAALTVTLDPAHASLPRLDQVYILIDDSTDGAAADDNPQALKLTGTATTGATLDNRLGAAALPSNALRIADVLVPAAAGALSAAAVRDRRQWARGAYRLITRAAADYTTGSGTAAAIDGTNLAPRIECSGNPVRLIIRGTATHNAASGTIVFYAYVDGAPVTGMQRIAPTEPSVGGQRFPIDIAFVFTPPAGSHIIAPYWSETGGTATLYAENTNGALVVEIEEFARQNAENT
jgi:hypothetical protein